MIPIKRLNIYIGLIVLMLASFVLAGNAQAAEKRISGDNRYSTAVKISQEGWGSSDIVVIARGDSFPDALAGAPLAYHYDAPILLTSQSSLHNATKMELQRLETEKVVILGGSAAISSGVESSIKDMGIAVERIAGKSRYDTAAQIAQRLPNSKAVLANGDNFPDALAVAPYAARNGIPILLTSKASLAYDTAQALKNRNSTIIVGGYSAVSKELEGKLPNPTRYDGRDRFETAHEVIRHLPMTNKTAYVATGQQFADALAGSVLAAKKNASILLTNPNNVPSIVQSTINTLDYTALIPFGGENAVSSQTASELSMLTLVDGDISKVSSTEWEVYKIVNQERKKQNLTPLRLHVGLGEVARIKSKDMHDKQYFSHTSPTYGSPFDMMSTFGLVYWSAGENIAAGQTDSSSVMNGWMNSPGHRSNILSTNFTHIGVGHHYGSKGYRHYWTQMFMTPRD